MFLTVIYKTKKIYLQTLFIVYLNKPFFVMTKSLEEVNQSVSTLNKKSVFKILAFGPAYLISVGYMDPETGQQTLQAEANLGMPCFGFY
jgi:hypothetical protein